MDGMNDLAGGITGATQKLAETALLDCQGFAAFFAKPVRDDHFFRWHFRARRTYLQGGFALRIAGAGHEFTESALFQHHGFAAFFTDEIRSFLSPGAALIVF